MEKAEPTKPTKPKASVVVICTRHEFQRRQDTIPDREKPRADLENRIRQIISEKKIDLIAEEAGDDTTVWKNLRREDELIGEEYKELFGGGHTVDAPVPTIGKKLADEHGIRHEDIDVDVRAKEGDQDSIKKRSDAMVEKILKSIGAAESVLVVVGKDHCADIAQRLKEEGFTVE